MKIQIVTIGLALILSARAVAEPTTDFIEKVGNEKQNILQSEKNRRSVLSELYQIHKKIKRFSRERGDFENQKQKAQAKAKNFSDHISHLSKKITSQKDLLKMRLRAHYKMGSQGIMNLVFADQPLGVLDRNLSILKLITDHDYDLLKDYQTNISTYDIKKADLEQELKKIQQLASKVQFKETQLLNQKKSKDVLLSQIDGEKLLHMTQLKRLRLESKNLLENQQELTQLKAIEATLKPSFFENRGALPLPIEAPVKYLFSEGPKDLVSLSLKTKGYFFQTPASAPVKSIFDGVVVYASKTKDRQNVVIISHDDHYYSVYSSLAVISTKPGQEVKQGEVIGSSGTSTLGLGQGLYFEIRHFSEAQDPKDWVRL